MTYEQRCRLEAFKLAAGDIMWHLSGGADLNPYSTIGARADWRRGFENTGPKSWAPNVHLCTMYQRGRACAELLALLGIDKEQAVLPLRAGSALTMEIEGV